MLVYHWKKKFIEFIEKLDLNIQLILFVWNLFSSVNKQYSLKKSLCCDTNVLLGKIFFFNVIGSYSCTLYKNRYCNQEGFSVLICGGKDKNRNITNKVLKLKIPSFKMKKFQSMVKPHCYLDLVNINSNILAFDDRVYLNESLEKSSISVEIYSAKT